MTTARELITGSLRLINAVSSNETPSDGDVEIAQEALNGLMESKSTDLLDIHTFTPQKFLLTPGKQSYKFGPALDNSGNPTGADWVTERPMRILQSNLMLYPQVTVTITPAPILTNPPVTTVGDITWYQVAFGSLQVQFQSSLNGAGGFTNFTWDFGDGGTATDLDAVAHTYAAYQDYNVAFSCRDLNGALLSESLLVTPSAYVPATTPPTTSIGFGPKTITQPLNSLADEEWSSIRLRTMPSTFPTAIYDNGDYPCRNLSFWPLPSQANGVELWLWEPYSTYNLDEQMNLPPGYERFIRFKLAIDLATEFGKEVPGSVKAIAIEAEAALKGLNQQLLKSNYTHSAKRLMRSTPSWTYLTMIMGDALPEVGK